MYQRQLRTYVISAYLDKVREVEVVKLQTHEIERTNRKVKMENKSTWPTNTIIRSSNILSHSVLATSVNLHFHQQGHHTKERLFAKGKIMKRKHNLKLRTFSFSELLLSLKLRTSHPLSFSTMLYEACILYISLFFHLFFFYLLLWQDLNLSKGRKPPPWI